MRKTQTRAVSASRNALISKKGKTHVVRKVRNVKTLAKRQGKNLLDLPMDILFEIFGHLEPLDLLHVLEASKALNKLLTGASSRVIWKRARANIPGLPDCPDDLSEVEYARLAFESHCQVCDQGRSYDLRVIREWSARVRYCSECFDTKFVPKQTGRKDRKSYPDELKALLPLRLGWHHHPMVCRSLDELWDKEYKTLRSAEQKRQWTDAKVAERKKINEHAKLCADWYLITWEKEKVERRKRMVEGRKERILSRLRELGWEHEITTNEYCNELLSDRRVRRACQQELTGTALEEVVDYLVDYLEQAKGRRLHQ